MKKTIMIASPLHDGRVESCYLCGTLATQRGLLYDRVPFAFFYNSGESLISRARNNICKVFLNRECPETKAPYTHLLMIDSDLGFGYPDVRTLLDAADQDHHIVAGVAPKKVLHWEAVHKAALAGAAPDQLSRAATRNVVNALPDYDYAADKEAVVPVRYAGTGFMMISRTVLLRFQEMYPELSYNPDYKIGDKDFDQAPEPKVTAFFVTMISPDQGRYLSEDYTFCYRAREAGFDSYVVRGVRLTHVGKYRFEPHPGGV